MEKMKAKEFKESLNKACFNMDVYGYEGILNLLINKLYADARELELHNNNRAANYARKRGDILYNILEARGYYNEKD